MKKTTLLLITLLPWLITANAQKATGLHVINTFHIASPGGWDYIAVGPVNNWLYITHGSQVNIINKNTGDSVGVIENTNGVHGIAFDVEHKKGFTSNGRLNNVTVFDINTNEILGQIPTGINPDAIMYEPYSKKIITCNGRSKNLSIIDPVQNKQIDSIDVGGKPETAVTDGAGKIYVNVEDKNEIVEIDANSFKVLNHWSLSPAEGPTGLAYDTKTKRLFAGCDKFLVVMDATNGKIIDKLTIGDGCDGVAFDVDSKNIYTSNGEGTITVIHEDDANKFTIVENVITKKSARTITFDRLSHLIYLPAADFETPEAGQKGRPKMKPGSFQVLVVGK
ncbi:MAG: YncE family protein [Ferruginibacter sp.]